ncbi:hypothetical protein RM023_10395 [Limosilactobacillus reuteri]|uniref:hypothetical protein n=1 Tax=Limosilactobacillus reuteri TaxID=1598 RepID=UPI0039BEF15E
MGTKTAKYWNNHNVLHFESDDQQIQILDQNGSVLGTLREMVFQGKQITSGNITDIRHSGVYRIRGLNDTPNGVPKDQECILSVTAIGEDSNNPSLIIYRLIAPNGMITEQTVSGPSHSGWGTGGIGLQNTINTINNSLGEISKLKTNAKNIVDAINELKGSINGTSNTLNEFKNHNHDDRYLKKTGDLSSGTMAVANGQSFSSVSGSGSSWVSLARMQGDNVILGDDSFDTNLKGKNIKINGSPVLTIDELKKQNVDSSTLGGMKASDFIKVNGDDTKNGNLALTHNHHIQFDVGGTAPILLDIKSKGKAVSNIAADSTGRLAYSYDGAQVIVEAGDRTLNLRHMNGIVLEDHVNDDQEPRLTWRRLDDQGHPMDAGIWLAQPAKWGGWSDHDKKHSVVWWNGRTNQGIVQYGVGANGETLHILHSPYIGDHRRRLFMQDEQPGGDIPVGSVWIGI